MYFTLSDVALPLGVAHEALSAQNWKNRRRCRVERNDHPVFREWCWWRRELVVVERHDRVEAICQGRHRI